jgi:hypothetical protein
MQGRGRLFRPEGEDQVLAIPGVDTRSTDLSDQRALAMLGRAIIGYACQYLISDVLLQDPEYVLNPAVIAWQGPARFRFIQYQHVHWLSRFGIQNLEYTQKKTAALPWVGRRAPQSGAVAPLAVMVVNDGSNERGVSV